MTTTANLALPVLEAGQAQKHVSVNEALARLDALVQLSVVSATIAAEPASPAEGALYILPAGKTGAAWGTMSSGALALYRGGVWEAIAPREGWLAYARDSDLLLFHSGTAWAGLPATRLATVSATDRVLGRVSASAGAVEEIAFTDQAQQLCDDTSFLAMLQTLSAGRAAFFATKGGTDQTGIPNGVSTELTWSTEVHDQGGYFASNGWTPPAGLVLLGGSARFTAGVIAGADTCMIRFFKNGAVYAVPEQRAANTTAETVSGIVMDVANGTDAYTLHVQAGGGTGSKTVSGNVAITQFWGHCVLVGVDFLFQNCPESESCVRWPWLSGAVAFGHGRSTQHQAVNDYLPHRCVV